MANDTDHLINTLTFKQLRALNGLRALNYRVYGDRRTTADLRSSLKRWCHDMDGYRAGLGMEKLREGLAKIGGAS